MKEDASKVLAELTLKSLRVAGGCLVVLIAIPIVVTWFIFILT